MNKTEQVKEAAAVKKIELSGGASRLLREAAETGWIPGWASDGIEEAELVRAGFVYDGGVTGAGYLRLQ